MRVKSCAEGSWCAGENIDARVADSQFAVQGHSRPAQETPCGITTSVGNGPTARLSAGPCVIAGMQPPKKLEFRNSSFDCPADSAFASLRRCCSIVDSHGVDPAGPEAARRQGCPGPDVQADPRD